VEKIVDSGFVKTWLLSIIQSNITFVFILQETNEPLVVERERTLSGGSSNSSSGSSSQQASSGGSSWEKVDTNDA
jgi:hypothetical protein